MKRLRSEVGGCRFDTIMKWYIRRAKDGERTGGENPDALFLCLDEGVSVGCEFVAVFKEFQIAFHIDADLYKLRMAVDADPIGFGLLDFVSLFKNGRFSILSKFRYKNTRERYPALLS